MNNYEFVEGPPPREGRPGFYAGLKDYPNQWAIRHFKTKATAAAVGTKLRGMGFETTARGADLYIRWPAEAKP